MFGDNYMHRDFLLKLIAILWMEMDKLWESILAIAQWDFPRKGFASIQYHFQPAVFQNKLF
jgi:hypothetical protein